MKNDQNEMILRKIESSFNKVVPVVVIVALFAAIAAFMGPLPDYFIWIDGGIAIVFLVLAVLHEKINIHLKIVIAVMICYVVGIISFLDGGFNSAGTLLIVLGNIVAVLFLKRIYGMLYSIGAVIMYYSLWRISIIYDTSFSASKDEWIIQILLIGLIVLLLQAGVYSMKSFLLSSILNLEENAKHINSLAYYDNLTKLPNLLCFKKILKERTLNHNVNGFIVYASIKSFDVATSVYGEQFANSLLIDTVNILKSHQKENVVIARVGENLFALWYENITKDELLSEFERYRILFKHRNRNNESKKRIDCFSSYYNHRNSDDVEQSIQKASLSMTYVLQKNSKNIIEYDIDFENYLREQEEKKELVKRAIENSDFEVYFQTKVDARRNKIIGVEALARWKTKDYGYISPCEFIPLIEELGLSIAFGNLIVEKALGHYSELQKKYGTDISLSINVSPTYLMSNNFVKNLEHQILIHRVPFIKVIIEITEEIVIRGLEEANDRLQEIRKMNIRVSLDDFGTGFSSLNYLMSLKVDELKIDKSFIDQLDDNPLTIGMLESIRHMSEQFNLALIVEGVEREEQVARLVGIGCHYIQGYFYSKPEKLVV